MSECLTCDRPFTPRPMHPAVESAWCDECWAVVFDCILISWYPGPPGKRYGPIPAMRPDDV